MNSNSNEHMRLCSFSTVITRVYICNVQMELETLKRLYVLLLVVCREWRPAPTFPLLLLCNSIAIIAKLRLCNNSHGKAGAGPETSHYII